MIERWIFGSQRRYAVVHQAETEVEALMLQGVLEAAGIPVVIRSRQIPFYGDVIAKATGVWGDLLVPAALAAPARVAIERYLADVAESSDLDAESS